MRRVLIICGLLLGACVFSINSAAAHVSSAGTVNMPESSLGTVIVQDTLGLEVFSMELDAITITAKSSKDYKRLKKSEKESIIESFKQKLREDFPSEKKEYKVLSGYRLLQDTVVMTSGSMKGTFVELPKAKKKGGDSLAVVDAQYKEYVNAVLKRNIEEMERKEQVNRQKRDSMLAAQTPTAMPESSAGANPDGNAMLESKAVASTNGSAMPESGASTYGGTSVVSFGKKNAQQEVHKLLWGVLPPVVLDELEDMKGKWDYIPNGDGTSYVVFRGHKGLLGIVRVDWAINYLVDSKTLGVIKITENLDAKLSIPFGMSIKGEDLESLNMLNIAYESFDSFKFRKGTISLKRYVEYENGLPVTKVLDMDLRVIGKQDKEIHMKAAAKVDVLASFNY